MAQSINLKSLVSSLDVKPNEFLLPLQEVIINAIQGIEDSESPNDGRISIKIKRVNQTQLNADGFNEQYRPITGFTVKDNGIGFVKKRYEAFNIAYTDLNAKKGCKGVGRYTVLACFGSMEVKSVFKQKEIYYKREFKFDLVKDIHPDHDANLIALESFNKPAETIIALNNYKPEFIKFINDNEIDISFVAQEIIQHCLLYFINGTAPQIEISYDDEISVINLNSYYNSVIKFDRTTEKIKIKEISSHLNLYYVRDYTSKSHNIHLCANSRQVGDKKNLSVYIPSLRTFHENGKNYHLSIYSTSPFLDSKVNPQRNIFTIPVKAEDKIAYDKISMEELLNFVVSDVKTNYSTQILEAEKDKNERIKGFILDPKRPKLEYRHLLNIPDIFEDVSIAASDEKLEADLHRIVYNLDTKRKKELDRFFNKRKYDKDDFAEIVNTVLKQEAQFSYDKLADVVIRRKSIILLFKKYLEWRADENYMLEEDLHNLIFTMGAESDVMPCDYHNLWLLDERLGFHSFTTSDRKLRTNKHLPNKSGLETDLLIYDFPWAFSDNPNSINSLAIFEFKRPGRNMNTSADRKLDSQVDNYFQELMESQAKNNKGKLLNIQDSTPKFGYIICELDNDLKTFNIKHNHFKETPYGSLYKINSEINMYIEVMTYDKLIEFAEQRHLAFFKALGIENVS